MFFDNLMLLESRRTAILHYFSPIYMFGLSWQMSLVPWLYGPLGTEDYRLLLFLKVKLFRLHV